MNLLNSTLFWWGLPFVVVPLLIHLINRMRYQIVDWAAMRFLKVAKKSSTRIAKLKEILILTVRTLLVLTLLLALANPIITGFISFKAAPDSIIIILDRSMSMEIQTTNGHDTLREKSINIIKESLEAFSTMPNVALYDTATQQKHIITDPSDISEDYFGATDTKADYELVFNQIITDIKESSSSYTQVWVATDSQKSNWNIESPSWSSLRERWLEVSEKFSIKYIDIASKKDNNLSIKLTRVAKYDELSSNLELSIKITRPESMSSIKVPITVNIGQFKKNYEKVLDEVDSIFKFNISVPVENVESWGSVEIPNDANNRDNKVYFAWQKGLVKKIYIHSKNKNIINMLKFASLSEIEDSGDENSSSEWPTNLSSYSLVCIHGPINNLAHRESLMNYMRNGGLVFCLPDGREGELFDQIEWKQLIELEENNHQSIKQWNKQSGILRRTDGGSDLALIEYKVNRFQLLEGEVEKIAMYENKQVAFAKKIIGEGQVVFLTSLPDKLSSNLINGHILVPLMQRLMNQGIMRFTNIDFMEPGLKVLSNKSDLHNYSTAEIIPGLVSGVYGLELSHGNHKGKVVVLNHSLMEFDKNTVVFSDLQKHFFGIEFDLLSTEIDERESVQIAGFEYILYIALALFLLESVLCLPIKTNKIASS